jgi:hypothetical protein
MDERLILVDVKQNGILSNGTRHYTWTKQTLHYQNT